MKVLYVSRLGKEFIGGADNLSQFLLNKFKEMFNVSSEDSIEFVGSSGFFNLTKKPESFDLFDLVIGESSALCDTMRILKISPDNLKKFHIFMHSAIMAQEAELSEAILGPGIWDVKDGSNLIHLFEKGFTPYYASANQVYITNRLCKENRARYLDISEFRSPNLNPYFPAIDDSTRIPNSILFASGYYHPAVGFHVLMKMLQDPRSDRYEWYLVGRTLPDKNYRFKDSKTWMEVYHDLLTKPNVHIIEFTKDLSMYYQKCQHNLILSFADSYSFKALEALSYGCINITTFGNRLLPWSRYAKMTWEFDIDKIATDLMDLLDGRSYRELPESIEKVLHEFSKLDYTECNNYLIDLFNFIIHSCREFFNDKMVNIDKKYFRFNRL